ncbi:MAG: hypothetical protein HYW38_02465 [Candidatus Colwellbacteria bacterium]|nr:hypothetical protein [Candidatus Colwellbacteria bacterium]
MTRQVRKILFITAVLLFILLGTVLVLYSRGARLDFKSWEVVQTGGVYLKTEPTDVKIEMNGKPVKNEAGFLQSGTLIGNLKPGTYRLVVEAVDYHDWQKEIKVESSTVAVLDGIILFPQKKTELVASPTDKFLLELSGRVLGEIEFNKLHTLFNELKEKQLRLPGPVSIKKILSYPYNDQKFVIMTDRALYTLDTEKRVVSRISPRAKDFTFAGTEVFWFDDKGLFNFNLILRTQSEVSLPPELKVTDWNKIKVSPSGEVVAVLKEDNELIIFDRPANKLTSLGKDATHFTFSLDSKRIAFARSDGSLNVYVIKDGAKKEVYILEGVKEGWSRIEEISWHEDNNYLFLKSGSNLYFVEANAFPPVNVVEVTGQVKNFFFNKDDDYLYWEDTTGVWRVKL